MLVISLCLTSWPSTTQIVPCGQKLVTCSRRADACERTRRGHLPLVVEQYHDVNSVGQITRLLGRKAETISGLALHSFVGYVQPCVLFPTCRYIPTRRLRYPLNDELPKMTTFCGLYAFLMLRRRRPDLRKLSTRVEAERRMGERGDMEIVSRVHLARGRVRNVQNSGWEKGRLFPNNDGNANELSIPSALVHLRNLSKMLLEEWVPSRKFW